MLDNQYADCLCYLPLSLAPLLFDTHRCRSHHVYEEPHSIVSSLLRGFIFVDLIDISQRLPLRHNVSPVGIPFRGWSQRGNAKIWGSAP